MRTLVIGDIHGSYKALLQVIERAEVSIEDTLIFLGDYCDGYPDNVKVIQYLIDLPNECIFIRGNHDVWAEQFLNLGTAHPDWFLNGGRVTYIDYIEEGYGILDTSKHLRFFRGLHNYYKDDKDRIFVHGGFDRNFSLKDNNRLYGSQIFYWDRELFEDAEKSKYYKVEERYSEIFLGHTSTLHWNTDKPMCSHDIWNLDTGAGWEGRLTMMDIDTKEYWQSDYSRNLYSENYKNRNDE